MSNTIVDQQGQPRMRSWSAQSAFADTGTDVLSENKQPLDGRRASARVPTLTRPGPSAMVPALTCGCGLLPLADGPGTEVPGVMLLVSFFLGRERYRYPMNLPVVAATGGPQCSGCHRALRIPSRPTW